MFLLYIVVFFIGKCIFGSCFIMVIWYFHFSWKVFLICCWCFHDESYATKYYLNPYVAVVVAVARPTSNLLIMTYTLILLFVYSFWNDAIHEKLEVVIVHQILRTRSCDVNEIYSSSKWTINDFITLPYTITIALLDKRHL